jgi:WXXGXW repeat (2 copies)
MRIRLLRGLIPALALAALPAISSAGVFIGVSVNVEPPPLPVYVQPPCPEPGYIWTPGYWAWNDGAYYWVPGTWVLPPEVGLLWTPGYWGWDGGDYFWHAGYWGPHVGFYGGVNYGFGYDGAGFVGGYWHGGVFFYNRAVWHVGPRFVTNVYYRPVEYHAGYEHVSFSGGPGGVRARPTRGEMVAEHEHHFAFTPLQQRQQRMAFADHSLRADYNHGRPPIAATTRPAEFHGRGTFAARAAGGPVHFAPARGAAPMRSDRPSWAAGQNHGARPMERAAPVHAQAGYERPQQRFEAAPQRRFDRPSQQRFESHPQNNFQGGGYRPAQRPQARPEPQFHQQFRPQARPEPQFHQQFRPQARPEPQFHQQFRPQERGPAARGPGGRAPAPHPQERGGGHRPPEDRGHHR